MYRLLAFSMVLSAAVGFASPSPVPVPTTQAADQTPTPKAVKGSTALVGYWVSKYQDKTIYLEFKENGDVTMGEGSQSMKGTYKIDLSVKPHQLNMTIAQRTKYTIFEFVEGGIRIAEPENKFPKEFGKNALVFKKTTPPQADSAAPAAPATPAAPETPKP
jgi:hypothetical protein